MISKHAKGYRSWKKGLWAEALCRFILRLKGWKIIAKRYKTPLGEIDLIIKRGKLLALVEIKARPTLDEAVSALTFRQQQRLNIAVNFFLSRHPQFMDHSFRFDIMVVSSWSWPQHIPDAWRP